MGITEIPARSGHAVRLRQGQSLKLINTHGHQVVDFWAFCDPDVSEFLSMEHMRAMNNTIFPRPGHALHTNRRRAVLHFVQDTSPGIHDTIMAACDTHRYDLLGCTDYHDNCTDNLAKAMKAIGIETHETPSPFNIWMNIPVDADGATDWCPPVSAAGDYVILRAEMDCICAMSCCPQDMLPVNAGNPVEVHFEVLD